MWFIASTARSSNYFNGSMALGRRYKLLDNVTIVFPVHVLNNLLFETTVRLVPVLSAFLITNFFTVKQIMDPFFDVQ